MAITDAGDKYTRIDTLALAVLGMSILWSAQAPADEPPSQDAEHEARVTPPVLKVDSQAEYPAEAQAAGLDAEVILVLVVDETGNVIDATVPAPAGHGFDEAAVGAAKRLVFEPARKADGTAVKARIRFRYTFELPPAVSEPEAPPPDPPEDAVVAGSPPAAMAGAEVRSPDDIVDVMVEGERPSRALVRRTLEKEEIDLMPGTRGDALKSLQSLPGVARPPLLNGFLIVRGSAPEDTKTFVDGTEVPLIYHFGGLSSVIPTEMLERIDFYPGNFGAPYGRAMGGIVDVGLRSPKSDGYHGLAQIDLIDGRLMFEGPVPLLDGWSFMMAGRRSWMDAWLGPALERAGAGVTQAPVYYDYQFMLENAWQTGRFRIAFFGSDDAFEIVNDVPPAGQPALAGDVDYHTAFQRIQLSYEERPDPAQTVKWMLSVGHDDVHFALGSYFFDLNGYPMATRVEYSHRISDHVTVDGGLDVTGRINEITVRRPSEPPPGQQAGAPFASGPPLEAKLSRPFGRPGGYVDLVFTPVRGLRLVPALRLDYALDSGSFDVSPRFTGSYDIASDFPKTTVKAGVGIYDQPPQFQESVEPFGTAGLSSNRAVHVGTGLEQEITRQLVASGEFFYKHLDDLVVGSIATGYTNDGSGYALGGEFLLKYKPDNWFYGWAAYTISRSVRRDAPDATEYLASYDQTHNLTIVGSLKLGRGWTVGARFRLVSGNRAQPVVCDPEEAGCDPNRINGVYHAPTATYVEIPSGTRSSERLPLFHQLDLRVGKKWQFEDWAFTAYLDVQNVYNYRAKEAISYDFDFTGRSYVEGLPILPSFGLRGEF